MSNTKRDNLNAKVKRGLREWGRDNWGRSWIGAEPKWWQKMHNIRPSRRREKAKLLEVRHGVHDDGNWPDYRRPHIWYF